MLDSKNTLYKKIDKLEMEVKTLQSLNRLLEHQLGRATVDLCKKDLKIKEMENGRPNESK